MSDEVKEVKLETTQDTIQPQAKLKRLLGSAVIELTVDASKARMILQRLADEIVAVNVDRLEQPDRLAPTAQEWVDAPAWADYHTVDEDGKGVWWSSAGIVLGADAWYHDIETLGKWQADSRVYDLTGLHWEESLRVRPR